MLQNSSQDVRLNVPSAVPKGVALLRDPALNKGTAFTEAERDTLHLCGLLLPHVSTQEQQLGRVPGNFRRRPTDLEKYISPRSLHDRSEALLRSALHRSASVAPPRRGIRRPGRRVRGRCERALPRRGDPVTLGGRTLVPRQGNNS
jgi:hypothetical protein